MQHRDPLFVALTKRETIFGGMLPYALWIYVTVATLITIIVTKQWFIMGVLYVCGMVLMAILQTKDQDIFNILALRMKFWSRSWSRNDFYWRARSYRP